MKSINVLIVEDEVLIAETIKIYLAERGHNVTFCAISFDEAVESYESVKPDVVLLDVNLYGEKSGIDFAKYLNNNGNKTPFVFLTSQYDKRILTSAMDTFPNGYLAKPIQKESLWTTIELAYSILNNNQENKSLGNQMIQLSNGYKSCLVKEDQILYLAAAHVYTDVVTDTHGTISVRESLNSLVKQLNPSLFILCHRSFAININEVESWNTSKIYIKKVAIPISRSRKEEVFDLLNSKNLK